MLIREEHEARMDALLASMNPRWRGLFSANPLPLTKPPSFDTFTPKAGVRTAVRFRALFSMLYDRLGDHPGRGPRRPALGPGIRIGTVSPYVVIYRHSDNDDTVTVLRIVQRSAGYHAQAARVRRLTRQASLS